MIEESGCEVDILEQLGYTEEYKTQDALIKISESYNNLKPSKYDNIYSTKFVIKRDEAILKYYIKKEEL